MICVVEPYFISLSLSSTNAWSLLVEGDESSYGPNL